jgi:Skp family chaperone for outer membrane proteins
MKHPAPLVVALTLLFNAWSGGTAHAQARIAKVNMRQLFEQYAKAKEQDAAFRKRVAGLAGEAKAKREAFQKGKDELQKFQSNPGDPAAVAKLKELKEMEVGILQFKQKVRADADGESRKLRGELLLEMSKVIDAKAKAGNYTMVVNISGENAAGIPNVLYSTPDDDITKDVLTELNAGLILKDIEIAPDGKPVEPAAPSAPATPAKPAEKKPEKKK